MPHESTVPKQDTEVTPQESSAKRSPEELDRLTRLYDSFQPLWLTETIQLGPLYPSDKDRNALLKHLNDPRVYSYLIGPPNPYTSNDADNWISGRFDRMTKQGIPLNAMLRDMAKDEQIIGAVQVSDISDDNLEGDDVGYWLAPEYHGQGLMAKALKLMLQEVSISKVGKRKFNATTFEGNWASRRTLEKAGFVYQPDIHKKAVKAGKELNLWIFRLVLTEKDIAQREVIMQATPLSSLAKSSMV
ncbi:hypothetical protein BG011_001430 [Mortierella polycephala]|uniref:N-acetyltransferase domain-containing protein n=1 Tax=Mortierella polycephala TaxID=41804 RepID=A0A9P6U5V2_9FUNG|nr:hypothetical protein BG011_001430 [Mortierella polycephala]